MNIMMMRVRSATVPPQLMRVSAAKSAASMSICPEAARLRAFSTRHILMQSRTPASADTDKQFQDLDRNPVKDEAAYARKMEERQRTNPVDESFWEGITRRANRMSAVSRAVTFAGICCGVLILLWFAKRVLMLLMPSRATGQQQASRA